MTHRAEPASLPAAWIGAVLSAGGLAVVLWWLSSARAVAVTPELVRVLADCAVLCALGFAVIPVLDSGVFRAELAHRTARPLAVASVLWLLAELLRLLVMAGQAVGRPPIELDNSVLWLYAAQTVPGRVNITAAGLALIACILVLAVRRIPSAAVIACCAAGIASRSLTGHLAQTPLGVAVVAVHAVSAMLWCGVLVGLLAVVRHRIGWARLLPAYSRLALYCFAALLFSGTIGAMSVIDVPADLYRTTYGRLLLIKIALAAGLVVLGWRNRTRWVPAARSQSISVTGSARRAAGELAVMAAALVAAAMLALAG
ncbi:MAG: CopD family protein [Mycobacterium sp.]|nr:CopD family protein [Mycobacterium sp.]